MIWNQARAASRRPLSKPYKAVKPIGEAELNELGDRSCTGCGYLRCSCKYVSPRHYGYTEQGAFITFSALVPHGQAAWVAGHGPLVGLLTEKQLERVRAFQPTFGVCEKIL